MIHDYFRGGDPLIINEYDYELNRYHMVVEDVGLHINSLNAIELEQGRSEKDIKMLRRSSSIIKTLLNKLEEAETERDYYKEKFEQWRKYYKLSAKAYGKLTKGGSSDEKVSMDKDS